MIRSESMNNKPLDQITKDDLLTLVEHKVHENQRLEFKESLPKKDNDDEKTKFLCTVASLANSLGGDVIFGIAERRHQDKKTGEIYFKGLDADGFEFDKERSRLTETILKGIDPRIGRVEFQLVEGHPEGLAIVMRVPRSLDAPHMVIFKDLNRFYSRHSSGKYILNVREIRQAFLASELLPERIRAFRDERITKIIGEDTPIRLLPEAKIVLHIVPYSAFDRLNSIDLADAYGRRHELRTIGNTDKIPKHNLDGFVVYGGRSGDSPGYKAYTQVFRNGIIEAVNSYILEANKEHVAGPISIPSQYYEDEIIAALDSTLKLLGSLDVEPPVTVMLSLVGVKGLKMARTSPLMTRGPGIDRDILFLPDVVIDGYGRMAKEILRPIFEVVWQAAGFEKNDNDDENG
jgi:hypothetical protein